MSIESPLEVVKKLGEAFNRKDINAVLDFYEDEAMEWRWRRRDGGNHTEVGASSEGYVSYRGCFDNAFSQFGDTVTYHRKSVEESGDPAVSMEIDDDDDGSKAEN